MTDLITKWPATLDGIDAGEVLFHTFETKYGPLSANPFSTTRFALRGVAGAQNTRAAFYLANSKYAALWEVVLRGLSPDAKNRVQVPEGVYIDRSIVTLTARQPIANVMRVDRPHRLRLVEAESVGDITWDLCCSFPLHEITHGVAHGVDQFLTGKGLRHAGLGWRSKQYPDGTVYVLYAPPFDGDEWEVGEVIALGSARGRALIRQAIEAAGYTWDDAPDEGPDEPEIPTA
jgi:hypothetical protein